MSRTTWLRYVPHDAILSFLARGWTISDNLLGTNHGHYAVLMVWPHETAPPPEAP